MEPVEHDIEDEIGVANHIMLRRINDVLLLILRNLNKDEADFVVEQHEQGIFLSPPPAWAGTDE